MWVQRFDDTNKEAPTFKDPSKYAERVHCMPNLHGLVPGQEVLCQPGAVRTEVKSLTSGGR